jgi:hypothetical protein
MLIIYFFLQLQLSDPSVVGKITDAVHALRK